MAGKKILWRFTFVPCATNSGIKSINSFVRFGVSGTGWISDELGLPKKNKLRIRRLHHWIWPRSLRSQLLSRSLFVLAGLLLLIGILQFWIMESFLYRNQAKTMEEQLMSMPPVWLGIQSRNGSSNNPFGGQVGNGSGNRVLFIPDRSLALFDNEGTFEDVFGEDGLKAPQLSSAEYQDITDELKEQKHIPYRIVTDSQGNEQLIVFASPGPRNRGLPMVQMGTATKPLRDLIIKQLLIFIMLSLLAMVAGLVLYTKVLRRTLVPLSNMVNKVQQIDAGKFRRTASRHSGTRRSGSARSFI